MDISTLKGVGAVRKQALNDMGIYTVADLLAVAPHEYRDLSIAKEISDLHIGEYALVRGTVAKVSASYFNKRSITTTLLAGMLRVVWFNTPYVSSRLKEGEEYLLYGKVSTYRNKIALINPEIDSATTPSKLKGIVPIYPVRGVTSAFFGTLVRQAMEIETPYDIVSDLLALDTKSYLKALHIPQGNEYIWAQEKYALREIICSLATYRLMSRDKLYSRTREYSFFDFSEVIDKFPYTLTTSQLGAIEDIICDLKSPYTMNRFISGDVGSGKSIVAYIAMYFAVKSGHKAVIMAPTEILADQHYSNMTTLFGDRVALLTSSSDAYMRMRVASGDFDYLVGTQALIVDDIPQVGLAIIDEQHRFGVKQREALEQSNCDTLVLSATPIPRSVMLCVLGALKESRLEKPSIRQEVKTAIVPESKIDAMYDYIYREAQEGRQTFIVCARIYDEDGEDMSSVEALYTMLKAKMGDTLGYIHGKMKATDKSRVLDQYRRGDIGVLLSTTVIEVGIDIKSATNMVILNAERYGLATLHQLRGRVGRGDESGYCFLVPSASISDSARERLDMMSKTNDGYALAEYDFSRRGGGDIFGIRQSGNGYKVDIDSLNEARRLTDILLGDRDKLQRFKAEVFDKYADKLKGVTLD